MMTDRTYQELATDELHRMLEDWKISYDAAQEFEDYDWTEEAVNALSHISDELRKRGELWKMLTDDDLTRRYRMGMVVAPIDTVMDEWQAEIEKRGLPVPREAWDDEAEAYTWWHSRE